MGPTITQDDKEKLQALNDNQQRTDRVVEDPADLTPEWELHRGKITKEMSKRITEYAEKHSNRKAAEKFNIPFKTVSIHRNNKLEWEDVTYIDSGRCAVMRIMAQEGKPLSEIADRFDCASSTVRNHVSATSTHQQCSHDLEIERVELS